MRTARRTDEMKFQMKRNMRPLEFGDNGRDWHGRTVMEAIAYERSVAKAQQDWERARLAEIANARGSWHLYREPKTGISIAIKTPRPKLECKLLADPLDGFGTPYEHLGRISRPRVKAGLFYQIRDSDRVPIGCAHRWAVVLGPERT